VQQAMRIERVAGANALEIEVEPVHLG